MRRRSRTPRDDIGPWRPSTGRRRSAIAASTSGSDTRRPATSTHHGNTKTTTASSGCRKPPLVGDRDKVALIAACALPERLGIAGDVHRADEAVLIGELVNRWRRCRRADASRAGSSPRCSPGRASCWHRARPAQSGMQALNAPHRPGGADHDQQAATGAAVAGAHGRPARARRRGPAARIPAAARGTRVYPVGRAAKERSPLPERLHDR